jgi:hypothetical protein
MNVPPRNGSATATAALTNGASTILDPTKPSLSVCVLSAYDLPVRDPPLYVSISVVSSNNADNDDNTDSSSINTIAPVKIGPPLQRHKDRNSFKFPRAPVHLTAPSLPELYQNTAVVKVVYPNASQTLTGIYPLHQLKLHETVWIILQLEGNTGGTGGGSTAGSTTSTAGAGADDEPPLPDDSLNAPPTLRLQWTLHGPYRAEIGFVVDLFQHWFGFVDAMENKLAQWTQNLPDAKFLWIPAAPLLAVGVVTAPVLAGAAVVTLPIAVPIISLLLVVLGVLVGLASFVYASTRSCRTSLAGLVAPAVQTIMATKAGQTALYQTGPRPTPVSMCRAILPVDGFISKLLLSLLIDAIGSASYLVPVVGEITDVGWAPVQMILLMALYENDNNNESLEWLKYVSFVEEIMPFTDIVPTATIGWFIQCGIPHWFGKDMAATLTSVLTTAVVPSGPRSTSTSRTTNNNSAFASTTGRNNGSVRQVVVAST